MTQKNVNCYNTIRPFGFERANNSKFYELAIGDSGNFAYPIPIKKKIPKALLECSLCDGIERKVLGTASFSFEGKKEADIYYHPRYVIAGEKVQRIFMENNIVGYKVCDLNIENSNNMNKEHIDELKELEIVGRCYRIFAANGQEIEHCPLCKKVEENERFKADLGIKVIEEFWDGSDIFMFDYGLLSIIVTEKIKKLFEEKNITNVQFIPLEEITML